MWLPWFQRKRWDGLESWDVLGTWVESGTGFSHLCWQEETSFMDLSAETLEGMYIERDMLSQKNYPNPAWAHGEYLGSMPIFQAVLSQE